MENKEDKAKILEILEENLKKDRTKTSRAKKQYKCKK